MERYENSHVLSRSIAKGAKYGSIAGLIATWSISTAIAASELELGLPISTFYAVIGISLSSNDFIASASLGFGLHLLTGTILGAIIGGIAVRVESQKNITNFLTKQPKKNKFKIFNESIMDPKSLCESFRSRWERDKLQPESRTLNELKFIWVPGPAPDLIRGFPGRRLLLLFTSLSSLYWAVNSGGRVSAF